MSLSIHKKIRAFTLLELLVGMIISGIVVAAGFNAYRIIAGQFKIYHSATEVYGNLSFFESQLQSDFHRANKITSTDNHTIRMIFKDHSTDWQFGEKYALRNDGNETDTFFVATHSVELLSVDGKEAGDDSMITSIKLKAALNDHSSEISCRKEASAETEIQTEFEKLCADGN